MKKCPKCGEMNDNDASTCKKCGALLSSADDKTLKRNQSSQEKAVLSGSKKLSKLSKKRYYVSLIILVVIILAAFIGYKSIYVPNKVESIVEQQGFNNSKKYSTKIDKSSHKILIVANMKHSNKIFNEGYYAEFPNKKLNIDKKVQSLANQIDSIPFGGIWNIKLKIHINDKKTESIIKFEGTKETQFFYESTIYRRNRKLLLEKLRDAKEREADGVAMGALFGNFLGSTIGDAVGIGSGSGTTTTNNGANDEMQQKVNDATQKANEASDKANALQGSIDANERAADDAGFDF